MQKRKKKASSFLLGPTTLARGPAVPPQPPEPPHVHTEGPRVGTGCSSSKPCEREPDPKGEHVVGTYFICFTIVLFPDSPAPGRQEDGDLAARQCTVNSLETQGESVSKDKAAQELWEHDKPSTRNQAEGLTTVAPLPLRNRVFSRRESS